MGLGSPHASDMDVVVTTTLGGLICGFAVDSIKEDLFGQSSARPIESFFGGKKITKAFCDEAEDAMNEVTNQSAVTHPRQAPQDDSA